MNARCMIQVKVPTEMEGHRSVRMAGGQEGGAMPRLDLMEIPTPRATITRPSVEIP